mgnify:CR=1 FL=1
MDFSDAMTTEQFLDFLFSKVSPLKFEIDLHDSDCCDDEFQFESVHQFCLFDQLTVSSLINTNRHANH